MSYHKKLAVCWRLQALTACFQVSFRQSHATWHQPGLTAGSHVDTHLQRRLCDKRSAEHFNELRPKVSKLAEKSPIDMSLSSKRERPLNHRHRRDAWASEYREANADKTVNLQGHYRVTCFLPVMDRLINMMERRFGDDTAMQVF